MGGGPTRNFILALLLVFFSASTAFADQAVQMRFANPGSSPSAVLLLADGNPVNSYLVPAGGYLQPDDVTLGTGVLVKIVCVTGNLVGNSYVFDGSYTELFSSTINDSGDPLVTYLGAMTIPQSRNPNSDDLKTLWKVTDANLTGNLYREGIDKLAEKIAMSGGGGGSGGGMSKTEFEQTDVGAIGILQANAYMAKPTDEAVAEEAAIRADALKTAIAAKTIPEFGNTNSGSSSPLQLTLGDLGMIVDFDPASNYTIAAFCQWLKAAIAWTVSLLFMQWLWKYFFQLYWIMSLSSPARGNPVVAGTGAQITSLTVALAITAVLLTLPTIYWALADSGFEWGSSMESNPLTGFSGSWFSIGVYLFDYIVPVATLLSCLVSYFTILKGGLVMVAGMQTLVRFFVQ